MGDLTRWSRHRAELFLGVDPATFDDLIGRYSLLESQPGEYLAQDIAGLAGALTAEVHESTPGWRGHFHRDGFAPLSSFASSDQMSHVNTWARSLLARGADQPEGAVAMFGPTGGLIRVNYLDRDPESIELISLLPFDRFARELVHDAVMYRLSIVVRSLATHPELGRHRDPRWAARVLSEPVFAFGLHLDATSGDFGDVYYSPGTHLLGVDGLLPQVNDPGLVELTLPTERGDAAVHNLGVVHGAHRYRVDRERVTVYCSFASEREVARGAWGPPQ